MNVVSTLVLATVLPESILGAHWFAVLSTFVAINTILYVSMSIFKLLPKPYLSDVVRRHGRRAETRSIYPNGRSAAPACSPRWAPSATPGELVARADADRYVRPGQERDQHGRT